MKSTSAIRLVLCGFLAILSSTGLTVPSQSQPQSLLREEAAALYKQAQDLDKQEKLAEAADAYQRACDRNHADGCGFLAGMYMAGAGVLKDANTAVAFYKRAVEIWQRQCDGSDAEFCNGLIIMYLELQKDQRRGADFFHQSCDKGYGLACTLEAEMYASGRGVAKNTSLAAEIYQRSCDASDASSCTYLAKLYRTSDSARSEQLLRRAAELWQGQCDGNDPAACDNLSKMYQRTDPNRAGEFFRRAVPLWQRQCDGGDAGACTLLGNLYAGDKRLPKDDNRARELYQKACDRGSAVGCRQLGNAFASGTGTTADEGRAEQSYRQACDGGDDGGCNKIQSLAKLSAQAQSCDGGDVKACYGLGLAYRSGTDAPKDTARAAQFLQRACERNFTPGCTDLAQMYVNGSGVARDLARALELFERSCAIGDARSCYFASLYAAGSNPSDPARGPESSLRAAQIQQQECDAGHAPSCFALGATYLRGSSTVPKDVARGLALLKKACSSGFTQACAAISRLEP